MAASNSSRGFNWNLGLGIAVVLVSFMAFSLPSLIVLSIGLLPTGVAYIIDRSEHKSGTFCVGGMNFSGVLPFAMKLWADNHTIVAAVEIVSDVFSLLIMYAAAGFGWLMFLAIPPVISSFLSVVSQTRLKVLRANQKKIEDEWGPEVVTKSDELTEGAPKVDERNVPEEKQLTDAAANSLKSE